MANALIVDAAIIAAALANSPFTLDQRKNSQLENSAYNTPLPTDNYTSVLDADGTIKRFGLTKDASNKLVPEASVWRRDGKHTDAQGNEVEHKAGDIIYKADGSTSYKATGQYVKASSGAEVRMYDSVLNRLTISDDANDKKLLKALTGDGQHDIFFSGAVSFAVELEEVDGRDWKRPRLVAM